VLSCVVVSASFTVSAELCSCSVALFSCFVGLIVDQPQADGGIISHCAVNVTVTQSSVVTHVHSGIILLYNTQSSDCHHLNVYHSLVILGRFISSQYVAFLSSISHVHQLVLNLIV